VVGAHGVERDEQDVVAPGQGKGRVRSVGRSQGRGGGGDRGVGAVDRARSGRESRRARAPPRPGDRSRRSPGRSVVGHLGGARAPRRVAVVAVALGPAEGRGEAVAVAVEERAPASATAGRLVTPRSSTSEAAGGADGRRGEDGRQGGARGRAGARRGRRPRRDLAPVAPTGTGRRRSSPRRRARAGRGTKAGRGPRGRRSAPPGPRRRRGGDEAQAAQDEEARREQARRRGARRPRAHAGRARRRRRPRGREGMRGQQEGWQAGLVEGPPEVRAGQVGDRDEEAGETARSRPGDHAAGNVTGSRGREAMRGACTAPRPGWQRKGPRGWGWAPPSQLTAPRTSDDTPAP